MIDVYKLYISSSLYQEINITNADQLSNLHDEMFGASQIDCFCISCKKESTFKSSKVSTGYNTSLKYDLERELPLLKKFYCTRDVNHKMIFAFLYKDETLIKVGQFPSGADLTASEIKQYQKLLGNEKYRELSRAIGLESHGVGIGSFVYLRRIFEGLIEEAHQEILKSEGWSESLYLKARMAEKIEMLKEYLPEFLVQNKALYSILSKGIHELSENECLEMFPVVKLGIELILDEKLKEKERLDKTTIAKQAIAALVSKIT